MRRYGVSIMAGIAFRLILPTCLMLAPLLAWQGVRVRASMPRLPEAARPAGVVAAGVGPGQGEPVRLAVLGESTAAGVGAERHEEAIAGYLAADLAGLTGREVQWRAVARIGSTVRAATRELVPRLADGQGNLDAVVVLLGCNDLWRIRRPRIFRRDMRKLVRAIRRQGGGSTAVVLAGMPPVQWLSILPQPLRWVLWFRSRALDYALRRLALRLPGVHHVPADVPLIEDSFFAADRFHPSSAGYRVWAGLLAPTAAGLVLRDWDGQRPAT